MVIKITILIIIVYLVVLTIMLVRKEDQKKSGVILENTKKQTLPVIDKLFERIIDELVENTPETIVAFINHRLDEAERETFLTYLQSKNNEKYRLVAYLNTLPESASFEYTEEVNIIEFEEMEEQYIEGGIAFEDFVDAIKSSNIDSWEQRLREIDTTGIIIPQKKTKVANKDGNNYNDYSQSYDVASRFTKLINEE